MLHRILTKPGYRIIAITTLIIAGLHYSKPRQAPTSPTPIPIPAPAQEKALRAYFESRGSTSPDRMAHACYQTSAPRLCAAVAVVESRGKVNAVNKRSLARGAFQVKEKFHGRVRTFPGSEVPQALQSEYILAQLLDDKDGNLKAALNAYGGSTSGRYARTVLAELQEVPR